MGANFNDIFRSRPNSGQKFRGRFSANRFHLADLILAGKHDRHENANVMNMTEFS